MVEDLFDELDRSLACYVDARDPEYSRIPQPDVDDLRIAAKQRLMRAIDSLVSALAEKKVKEMLNDDGR